MSDAFFASLIIIITLGGLFFWFANILAIAVNQKRVVDWTFYEFFRVVGIFVPILGIIMGMEYFFSKPEKS